MPQIKLTNGTIIGDEVRNAGDIVDVSGPVAEGLVAEGHELVRASAGAKGKRGVEKADA